MSVVFDHCDDNGRLLQKIAASGSEIAKIARKKLSKGIKVRKSSGLDEEFGLVVRGKRKSRYFPLIDLPNALASFVYFQEVKDKLPKDLAEKIEAKILSALKKHGLSIPIEVEKTASIVECGELPEESKPVPVPKHKNFLRVAGKSYGFTGRRQLEKLAESAASEACYMTPLERREVALQLVFLGVKPKGLLEKYASLEENPSREYWYNRRREILKTHRPDALGLLDEIERIDNLEVQASLLDRLDQETHIRKIPDAFCTVFGEPVRAEESPDYDDATLEKVASVMGKKVAERIRSGGAKALSPEEARIFRLIMEG